MSFWVIPTISWSCLLWPVWRHNDGWWHEALAVFISGVTHWRLAGEEEQDHWLDPAQ